VKYPFQPGQKFMCQRQKRPANDFGLLSYLERNLQFAHPGIVILLFHHLWLIIIYPQLF
jgi:hypothetical protein